MGTGTTCSVRIEQGFNRPQVNALTHGALSCPSLLHLGSHSVRRQQRRRHQLPTGETANKRELFARWPSHAINISFNRCNRTLCYLSLSLGGPEELCGGGPVASGLPTGKPAPKLVI